MFGGKGKRMCKCYMKIFRRELGATVLTYCIIYTNDVGRSIDHLKFRTILIEGLLIHILQSVKY
jgi:hypothetical protein